MTHRKWLTGAASAAGGLALFVSAAQAAPTITYVSTKGANTGDCTMAAPCRSLAFAIGVTQAGGEVHVLDSGRFGAQAVVKKSLTIVGGGNTVDRTPIIINAAGATVILRDLVLNGAGAVTGSAIEINNAATVQVERCSASGFSLHGIHLNGVDAAVIINDSILRNNSSHGAELNGAANAAISINNSRFEDNDGSGLRAFRAAAAVTRSVAAGNAVAGFVVNDFARMTLERSIAFGNPQGLVMGGAGTARLSNSVFTGNGIGIVKFGTVLTRENNIISGNGTNILGPAPTVIGGT